MIRVQIYLSEKEKEAIQAIALEIGKSQSQLIRQAVDQFIEKFKEPDTKKFLQQAKGLWKDRQDLPDFSRLRQEWGRDINSGSI
jgi:predicted transcriptional regulator